MRESVNQIEQRRYDLKRIRLAHGLKGASPNGEATQLLLPGEDLLFDQEPGPELIEPM